MLTEKSKRKLRAVVIELKKLSQKKTKTSHDDTFSLTYVTLIFFLIYCLTLICIDILRIYSFTINCNWNTDTEFILKQSDAKCLLVSSYLHHSACDHFLKLNLWWWNFQNNRRVNNVYMKFQKQTWKSERWIFQ